MSGIEGKVVAITGASSGIGEATAVLLADRGAKIVLGARRGDRLEALAARITAAGGEAAYVRTDVTRREDVAALVALACMRSFMEPRYGGAVVTRGRFVQPLGGNGSLPKNFATTR